MISLAGWLITSASPDIIFSTKLLVIQPAPDHPVEDHNKWWQHDSGDRALIITEFVVGGRKIFGNFACSDTDV